MEVGSQLHAPAALPPELYPSQRIIPKYVDVTNVIVTDVIKYYTWNSCYKTVGWSLREALHLIPKQTHRIHPILRNSLENSPPFIEPEGSYYRVHNNLSLVPFFSQLNPVYAVS
jgi:hypothetical protein